MTNAAKTKQIFKILIGAAWIDGTIQSEERDYLHKMAQENNLAEDPEIKPWLSEAKQVKPEECYRWVEEYLGDNPDQKDYEQLLETLSALIYSDGQVDTEEAKLLMRLQVLETEKKSPKSAFNQVLHAVRKFYRKGIKV